MVGSAAPETDEAKEKIDLAQSVEFMMREHPHPELTTGTIQELGSYVAELSEKIGQKFLDEYSENEELYAVSGGACLTINNANSSFRGLTIAAMKNAAIVWISTNPSSLSQ